MQTFTNYEIPKFSGSCFRKTFNFQWRHRLEKLKQEKPDAVFLVVCDPSMNELWAT